MSAPPIAERHKHHFHRQAPIKEAVRVATTANITIATALNAGDTIDGVTLAAGDRVLVKDQSTGSQNGIYVAGATPVRDYDVSSDDPAYGYIVLVLQGTTNAATLWQNTNTSSPTINTTALTFSQVSGGSGAPSTADYLVGTANGGLSAEIVVGTTPGGELGGTWASPTIDTTHAGTNHLQPVRKNSAGTVFERRRLNLIEGTGVTLTVADDAGNDEVDITIAATGGGGGSLDLTGDTGSSTATDDITFIGAGGIAVDVNDLGGGAAEVTIDGSGVSGGGSTDDPILAAFGTPDTAFEFASSSLAALTTFGSPDVLDAHTSVPDNLYVKDKNSSFQWCGVFASASAAPGTVITKVTGGETLTDFHYVGCFLGVATPGAMAMSVVRRNNSGGVSGPAYWYGVTTTSGDTGGTIGGLTNIQWVRPPYYLAVVATSSTSFGFYYSSNGRTWMKLGSGLNPSLTIGSFGVGINSGAENATGLAASFEYVRYWTTAKTIPST